MGAAVPFGVPPPPPKKAPIGRVAADLAALVALWRDPAAWCRLPSFNGELDRQFEVYAAAVRRACVDEYRERLRRDRTGDMWPAEGPLPVRRSRVGLDRRRARLAGGAARRGRRPGRAEAIDLLFERLRGLEPDRGRPPEKPASRIACTAFSGAGWCWYIIPLRSQ